MSRIPQPIDTKRLIDQGIALRRAGKLDEAAVAYERVIAVQPYVAEAHYNLGIVRRGQGRMADAAACWRRAVELKPNFLPAYNNLGGALLELGDIEDALATSRRGLALDPNSVAGLTNLGNALRAAGDSAAAAENYRKAIALKPEVPTTFANLGLALRDLCRFAESEAAYRRAIELQPGYASAHKDLGILLLLLGRFAEGWREYARRWKTALHPRPQLACPAWRGEDLAGKSILLYGEQGLGDTIMFCRFAAILTKRGARVILEVPPPLKRLMQDLYGAAHVIARGAYQPPTDFEAPLMDLPELLAVDAQNIPAEIPYLHAAPDEADKWKQRLGTRPGLKVGLVWAGNPQNPNDRVRSITPEMLAPLLTVPKVAFYSLQVGAGQPPTAVDPLSSDLHDFADTAACIHALDLVISVDTATAHLAGAMGKEVWILLPQPCDWRWLLERSDTPWYPSAKLFRQEKPGHWPPVIEKVAAALKERP